MTAKKFNVWKVQQMRIFDDERIYDDSDTELDVIASKTKRAQWRHKLIGPKFLRFGRRIKYRGTDLNAYVEASLVETATHNAA